MAGLKNVVSWLDEQLAFQGEDDSCNGLQFQGKANVRKVAFAVDACQQSFEQAVAEKADLLVVHHGLFWKKRLPTALKGEWKNRLKTLFDNDLSLYASHLPLDAHPRFGNNAELARLLGLRKTQRFAEYHGFSIGLKGVLPKSMTFKDFKWLVKEKVGFANSIEGASQAVRSVGVSSGGSAFCVPQAREQGLDAVVIGEFTHSSFHSLKESGVDVIAAGHYATETLGVKALAKAVAGKFGVETSFANAPTGL